MKFWYVYNLEGLLIAGTRRCNSLDLFICAVMNYLIRQHKVNLLVIFG